MVLWLNGSVTSSQMKELLQSEHFRNRVKRFIHTNIKADIPGYVGSQVLNVAKEKNVAFSRPIDPRTDGYEHNSRTREKIMARTVQVHQCGAACMKVTKTRLVCKCQAPFVLSDSDWVNEDGECGLKRTYGYLNNWCPPILQCIRSNHDIKLISNGTETKDIAWYISVYVGKKRKRSSNTSALLANTMAFHQRSECGNGDLKLLNKKLIQRCANTLSRQQELSAPEVISYLMGWGDRYESHHFVTIHWYSVCALLKRAYPELKVQRYASVFVSAQKLNQRPGMSLS